MEKKNVVDVKNLKKTYSKKGANLVEALKSLNLEVKEGEIFGLLGPNGAGKSTFINILGGSVIKSEGTENYERLNERVKHANDEIRRKDEEIEDKS